MPTASASSASATAVLQTAVAGQQPTATPAAPDPGSEAGASAEARSSGIAQVVDDLTTSTSQTTANPDGSFTRVQSLLPTRVDRGGTWVPVDTTLQTGADGMVRPAASSTDIAFSGGGSAPLVRVVSAAGNPLTISYPDRLPTPVLAANTATYPEVMPGVDLVVTATDGGGFSEVLTVKTAAAAANPDLARIDFAVAAIGLNIAADPTTGALHGSDVSGLQFTAPTPLMWDSATSGPSGSSGSEPDPSDGSTPGQQAQTSVIDADPGTKSQTGGVTTQTLSVRPDPDMLTDPATVYPVYIDPVFATAIPRGTQHFTWVQSGCPTTSNYDSQSYDPGVGKNAYTGCVGVERSFFQLDTTGFSDVYVNSAQLKTTVTYSAKFCPATGYTVKAAYSYAFTAGTTWNNQPGAVTAPNDDSESVPVTHCQGQSAVNVNFDVTKSVRRASDNNYANNTYLITGSETDEQAFKRFGDNPTLSVTYDKPPNDPTGLAMNPAPTNGWVGATNAATPLDLSATLSSPIPGQVLHGVFTLTDTGTSAKPLNGASSGDVPSGGTAHRSTPVLTNGHDYVWSVYASDGLLTSAIVNGPQFGVDTTPPTMASITSTNYPVSGSTTQTTKHAGDPGAFTFTATDDHSGIARIDWQLNTALPAGTKPTDSTISGSTTFTGTSAADASRTATATVTPGRWGTNVLFARVVDKAGNTSQTKQYIFYAPANPTSTPHLGDIDGDSTPDIITTTPDGRLRVYPADRDPAVVVPTNTDPAIGPYIASTAADGPSGSWTGTILTHRGSFSGRTVDDLFVWKNDAMYVYTNSFDQPGHYKAEDATTFSRPTCTSNCAGYPSDWSALTAMVATGDVTGDPYNDLITIENNKLWLYQGVAAKRLVNPIGLSLTLPNGSPVDVAHAQLIAPGTIDATGSRGLWIRDRITGTVTQFTGTGTPDGLTASGTTKATGFTADAAPTLFVGGDFLHDNDHASYVPSLVSLSGSGALQLRETPTSDPSQITTAAFGATVTAVENQTIRPTRNVYVPITPARLVDTRTGSGGTLSAGVRRTWAAAGTNGIPATGVTAIALSVTALNATTANSYVRFGDNGTGTATSTINPQPSIPLTNFVVVVPDAQGKISGYLGGTGTADVVVDVAGYYTSQADADAAGTTANTYVPLAGARVCDTRTTSGNAPGCTQLTASTTRTYTIAGYGGVPAGATAVTLNISTPNAASSSFVTAWPSGQTRPVFTVINPSTGQSTSATTLVPLSAAGQLSLYSPAGTFDVVLDVQGYYLPTTTTGTAATSTYVPVPPSRIFHTDDPQLSGASATPLGNGATRSLKITGATDSNGTPVIPASGVCAAVLNVGAIHQSGAGFLRIQPQGTTVTSSSLSYPVDVTRANLAIAKLSSTGSIDIVNPGTTTTDVFVDIIGYFAPSSGTC